MTPRVPIVGPAWEGYTYAYGEGLLARIHFDVEAAMEPVHLGYPESVRVILFIPVDRVASNGQPDSNAVIEVLLGDQRRLIQRLESESIQCRFVGSMLYGAMQDLAFQIESAELSRFRRCVDQWQSSVRSFRVEVKPSHGWTFFDEKIRPKPEHVQQISDRQVIQRLIAAGSDPALPHQLEHQIHGAPEQLQNIAHELLGYGFTNARWGGPGSLWVDTTSPLDPFAIWNITGWLVRYCAAHGVRYVGWGAAVVGCSLP